MKMFGSYDVVGYGEVRPQDDRTMLDVQRDSLRFNLCRSATLTAQAHIGALNPKPKFQTNDADWSLTRQARDCEHAVNAIFYQNDFNNLKTKAFLDAAVSSIGGIKVYAENNTVKMERVFPGEILVDVREGYYGCPRNLYQIKQIDRDTLRDKYPGKDDVIDATGEGDLLNLFPWLDWQSAENQALVVEAWHLGVRNKKGDFVGGKRVIATPSGLLAPPESWNRETFPFAFYRWEDRQCGFYGRGIVEQLRTHQRTLNYIDLRIRDHMHYLSRGKLVVWDNPQAKVNVEHLTTSPEDIIKITGTGQPPTVVAQNAVPSEWWAWRKDTIESAFRELGINELAATGSKPPGVEAGIALRELQDASARRFRPKTQANERFVIECAKLIIRELKDSDDTMNIRAKVKRGSTTYLQEIKWSEVALDDNQYQLEVMPASSLPDTTAGRLQTVQDWYQAGFITQLEAKSLLDFPDLEAFKSLDLAPKELILESIETMIEDGEYVIPEPSDNLDLIIKLGTLSYQKFRLRKAPSDRLELLLRYVDDAQSLKEMAMQKQAAPVQAAQMAPEMAAVQQNMPGGMNPADMIALAQGGMGGGAPGLPPTGAPPAIPAAA